MSAFFRFIAATLTVIGINLIGLASAQARDLQEIRAEGVLRHIGTPYAHFITGSGDGLDVELMQGFAKHLGVSYRFVESPWNTIIADLTGRQDSGGKKAAPPRGDVIASGLTILPDREKLISYSTPTFPSGVWLIAPAHSAATPIRASGSIEQDIENTKSRLNRRSTLVVDNTCLDPKLYNLERRGLKLHRFIDGNNPIELIPAMLRGDAELSLLDVPDAIVGLEKWPGEIKIIGPISGPQAMGLGFRKTSPQLLAAFNEYFSARLKDGSYLQLVRKYYPAIPQYFPDFFGQPQSAGYVR
ncbi:MAG TPA: transporter substrate-binding domain-containing protein [Azonexus sp.]|nr:transporter substrate-binding domain-containing protein [Azonexus sp.]